MVGKSKNRKRDAEHFFKFFTAPSSFNKCEQKQGHSEKRDGNGHIFANTGQLGNSPSSPIGIAGQR